LGYNQQKIVTSRFQLPVAGTRDKLGNPISYLILANYIVKDYTFEEYVKSFTYIFRHSILKETLDCFRNGVTFVESLKNVSIMKNVDTRVSSQKLMKSLPNNFPLLIRSILVVDAGFIIKILLKIAKFFVKKKVIARVRILEKREQLLEYIDSNQLITEFGGTLEFDFDEYVKQTEKECREWIDVAAIALKKKREAEGISKSTTSTTTTTTTTTTTKDTEKPVKEKGSIKQKSKDKVKESEND